MKKSIEMNNISIFLNAAKRYGVNMSDLFQVCFCSSYFSFMNLRNIELKRIFLYILLQNLVSRLRFNVIKNFIAFFLFYSVLFSVNVLANMSVLDI